MFIDVDRYGGFRLDDAFVEPYRDRPVRWGFGALSWVTYKRTYSRDGESWWQTCRRVIEGQFTIERIHCLSRGLPWDPAEADAAARDAYARMWAFKWTPPGRGLWMMGTRFVYERGGAALNNCGFVSTRHIDQDYADPFVWMFGMSMVGVGVGFDTAGRGRLRLRRPAATDDAHVIDDSREGWCDALRRLLDAYVGRGTLPARWDFSRIRPRGTPLAHFGGVASGPGPLEQMLRAVGDLCAASVDRPVDSTLIVDTMNLVGRCVVAGGIRRSAQIALGDPDDRAFLDLKQDPEKLAAYRWASNNSVVARVGMDYEPVARRTARNGEPGFFWLENARRYGRLADPPSDADAGAMGTNPCAEQTLWDRELCCLVETYPAHHHTLRDYRRTLDAAFRYAKVVTLVPVHDPDTRAVMERNRRIGCSMTGIVQAMERLGQERFFRWCDRGYRHVQALDRALSKRLNVNRSIKTTSVKPSGTVSLLAGATPGVHWEHAEYYLRRLRMARDHPVAALCGRAGYDVEPDRTNPDTVVVAFPVHVAHAGRRMADVPLTDKVALAVAMQRHWSDNQVSCTVEFDPDREADGLVDALRTHESQLKSIVFLPRRGHGYAQPPYEAIDRAEYERRTAALRPIVGEVPHEHELEARFCEGGPCDYEIQNP